MRTAFLVLLLVHGVIHVLGFVKGLGLAPVAALQVPITPRVGALWLFAAGLLVAAAALMFAGSRLWWGAALPGVLLSQTLIVMSWSDAKFGTLANLIAVVPLVVVIADLRPSSLRARFERDAARALAREATAAPARLVTEADLSPLPVPVQRYLRRIGVVRKPRVRSVRLEFAAQMRSGPDAPWMDAPVTQYEFYDPPSRLFFMQASRGGVPFDVLHRYVGDAATFEVRVAGLVPMVNVSGPVMTQSETVTLFNDICLLAPGALIGAAVTWTTVDDRTVRGRFTNAGHTIEASLFFDEEGDLTNFVSDDRYQLDGEKQLRLPWSTPVTRYADFDGIRLAADAEARWLQDGREWTYGRFTLKSAQFNVKAEAP